MPARVVVLPPPAFPSPELPPPPPPLPPGPGEVAARAASSAASAVGGAEAGPVVRGLPSSAGGSSAGGSSAAISGTSALDTESGTSVAASASGPSVQIPPGVSSSEEMRVEAPESIRGNEADGDTALEQGGGDWGGGDQAGGDQATRGPAGDQGRLEKMSEDSADGVSSSPADSGAEGLPEDGKGAAADAQDQQEVTLVGLTTILTSVLLGIALLAISAGALWLHRHLREPSSIGYMGSRVGLRRASSSQASYGSTTEQPAEPGTPKIRREEEESLSADGSPGTLHLGPSSSQRSTSSALLAMLSSSTSSGEGTDTSARSILRRASSSRDSTTEQPAGTGARRICPEEESLSRDGSFDSIDPPPSRAPPAALRRGRANSVEDGGGLAARQRSRRAVPAAAHSTSAPAARQRSRRAVPVAAHSSAPLAVGSMPPPPPLLEGHILTRDPGWFSEMSIGTPLTPAALTPTDDHSPT